MSQSPLQSGVETVVSTVIGYSVAVLTQLVVFPIFSIHISAQDNFLLAWIFTIVSLICSYWIRRLFNWIHR